MDSAVTEQEIQYALIAALLVLLVAVLVLILRVRRLESDLPGQLVGAVHDALEAQHREMLGDLHTGLGRQADRLTEASESQSERLRGRVDGELRLTRDAMHGLQSLMQTQLADQRSEMQLRLNELSGALQSANARLRSEMIEQTLARLGEHARADRELLQNGLRSASEQMAKSSEALNRTVNERLEAITGQVHQRLDEGFKKTNETFTNVMARLATIDEAQKKIDGLTTNVVSLQELLGDKRGVAAEFDAAGHFRIVGDDGEGLAGGRRKLRLEARDIGGEALRARGEAEQQQARDGHLQLRKPVIGKSVHGDLSPLDDIATGHCCALSMSVNLHQLWTKRA